MHTDLGSPLLSNNQSALNQRGTGVVDAIQDGLWTEIISIQTSERSFRLHLPLIESFCRHHLGRQEELHQSAFTITIFMTAIWR